MPNEKSTAIWEKIRPSGRVVAIFAGSLALVLAAALAFELWLPRAIEAKWRDVLDALSEPGKVEFTLLSADRRNARIACTVFDGEKKKIASLPEIRVRYSPFRLLQGNVKEIVIAGGTLAADDHDWSSPSVPVLDMLRARLGVKADLRRRLPLDARKIQLDGVEIRMAPRHQYAVERSCAVSGVIYPDKNDGWNMLHFQLDAADREKSVWSVRGDYRFREHELELSGDLRFDPLGSFGGPGLRISLRGVTVRLNESSPWKRFRSTRFDFTAENAGMPVKTEIIGGSDGPTSVFLTTKAGNFAVDQGFAVYDAERGELEGSANLMLTSDFALPVRFLVRHADGACTVSVSSLLPDADREKAVNLQNIELQAPSFELTGKIPDGDAPFDWKLEFSGSKIRVETSSLQLAAGEARGKVKCTGEPFQIPDFQYELKFTNAAAQSRDSGQFSWHAPEAELKGKIFENSVLASKKGSVSLCGGEIQMDEVEFQFSPFESPASGRDSFSVGSVRLRSRMVGSLTHGVLATGTNPDGAFRKLLSGEADGTLFGLNGRLRFQTSDRNSSGFSASFDAGKQRVSEAFRESAAAVFPRLGNLSVKGELAAKFDFFKTDGVPVSVFVSLEKADLALARAAFAATGVDLHLNVFFPAGAPVSPAGQKFSFSSLRLGGFSCGAGRGAGRLDPKIGWDFESFSASWCGGRVSLLPPDGADTPEYTFILDRIELAPFLNQLGLGTFTGKGRISGRIPVRNEKTGLRIADGTFQSEPDENGTLKGILRVPVMPVDKNQELDSMLTSDTLPDMSYLWLRGSLSSPEKGLSLKMEFNGKPLRPLYYEFDSGKRLKKSDTPRGLPQLKFSVSFNLPVDEWDQAAKFFAPR